MILDYFADIPLHFQMDVAVYATIPTLYQQEHNWSCAVACLRTICGIETDENSLIDRLGIIPGPHYSKEIMQRHWVPDRLLACYGALSQPLVDISDLWELMRNGYRVMAACDFLGGHWVVLLAIIPTPSDWDLVYWDPYFACTRVCKLEEFAPIWRDFIAVRKLASEMPDER